MSKAFRMETVTMIDEDRVGKTNDAEEPAPNLYGHVVDEVRRMTTDQPFGALLGAMGIGLAFGLLTSRR